MPVKIEKQIVFSDATLGLAPSEDLGVIRYFGCAGQNWFAIVSLFLGVILAPGAAFLVAVLPRDSSPSRFF